MDQDLESGSHAAGGPSPRDRIRSPEQISKRNASMRRKRRAASGSSPAECENQAIRCTYKRNRSCPHGMCKACCLSLGGCDTPGHTTDANVAAIQTVAASRDSGCADRESFFSPAYASSSTQDQYCPTPHCRYRVNRHCDAQQSCINHIFAVRKCGSPQSFSDCIPGGLVHVNFPAGELISAMPNVLRALHM